MMHFLGPCALTTATCMNCSVGSVQRPLFRTHLIELKTVKGCSTLNNSGVGRGRVPGGNM